MRIEREGLLIRQFQLIAQFLLPLSLQISNFLKKFPGSLFITMLGMKPGKLKICRAEIRILFNQLF